MQLRSVWSIPDKLFSHMIISMAIFFPVTKVGSPGWFNLVGETQPSFILCEQMRSEMQNVDQTSMVPPHIPLLAPTNNLSIWVFWGPLLGVAVCPSESLNDLTVYLLWPLLDHNSLLTPSFIYITQLLICTSNTKWRNGRHQTQLLTFATLHLLPCSTRSYSFPCLVAIFLYQAFNVGNAKIRDFLPFSC